MQELRCHWLPELILFENFKDWFTYEEHLYAIFKRDFLVTKPYYLGKPVKIRFHPKVCDKEQTFFHITSEDMTKDCIDPNDRIPDFRRCERIAWPRSIIENYECPYDCPGCEKVLIWEKQYKMYRRVHMLLENFKYLIVLEKRENYCLFITAFYITEEHTLRKKKQEYEKLK